MTTDDLGGLLRWGPEPRKRPKIYPSKTFVNARGDRIAVHRRGRTWTVIALFKRADDDRKPPERSVASATTKAEADQVLIEFMDERPGPWAEEVST